MHERLLQHHQLWVNYQGSILRESAIIESRLPGGTERRELHCLAIIRLKFENASDKCIVGAFRKFIVKGL